MARRTLLALAVALPAAFATALAQTPAPGGPPAPPLADYALTNVRIVTAPGRVIERGTVLTRDGRIAAVGANVTIPAGVVQMDLAGHTVFPGLIDAATSIGLPSPSRPLPTATPADAAPAGGRGGRGGGAPQPGGRGGGGAGGPSAPPPPVVAPEVDASAEAADMFAPTPDQLKALRAGGITTVGLVFQGGLFPGRVGAALTGTRDDSRLALRTGVGQEVSFGTRRGGYPGTGIGAVAFVRQSFLDAQYEARLDKAMKAGTPGARPSNDPFERALMPAAGNEMSSWFVASTERQITRVAEIAKEMGLKSPVVVGAQEGWRSVSYLKGSGATAVVSLNFPSPDSITGREFKLVGSGKTPGGSVATDPAALAEVRGNAAALIKAGVPVALASFGGESGTTFRERIKTAIDAGLSPDDALRAATVTPAAVLGVTAAVGTIEVGKLANLVVVTGNDLFATGTPIKHVFVEGRLY
jgi:imidazolonepropionase-like amidohydrolase